MHYRISRDASLEAIQLYLFVKTLPLDRFISLFISCFSVEYITLRTFSCSNANLAAQPYKRL